MTTRNLTLGALAAVLATAAAWTFAADPATVEGVQNDPAQITRPARGWQLMTPEERAAHREAMLNAKTPEERQALREQQHKLMQERAAAQGITLPDKPGPYGHGWQRGQGPGYGAGPGYGGGRGGCRGFGPGPV
ncbi:MAG TPA: hypothetical protein VLW45_09895 [Pelomicrobium sp.]|nr:hypothetical protein [Pelomicrobium sp.]